MDSPLYARIRHAYIYPMDTSQYTRTILSAAGPDAVSFLQGVTTQDMTLLKADRLHFTAFLSPQGKLLHDAFAWKEGDAIFLDTDAQSADALLQFLTRYKLRAKVTLAVTGRSLALLDSEAGEGFPDPRDARMPKRFYDGDAESAPLSAGEYHQARLTLALPEATYDSKGDDVAMDLGYDALGAISFTKGCYVGQEVTARMHYKQVARKSILRVTSQTPLPAAYTPIACGALTLGALRSSLGTQAIALVRLDTWEEALISTLPVTCDAAPVILEWPQWALAKRELWRQAKLADAR